MRGGKRPTLPLESQTLKSTAQDTADVLNGTAGDVTAQISALKSAALLRAQSVVDSRRSVRDLAALWDPDTPTIENAAYIKRARELEQELQTMLLSQLEENGEAAREAEERERES